jgi:hypothetical protein
MSEYHIKWFDTCTPHWPNGGWSLYRISGDEIAIRTPHDKYGKLHARHAWCGYLGIWETLPEVMKAIEQDKSTTAS